MFPLIAAGCAGTGFTVIASVCAVLVPQLLFAVTLMVPLVAPGVTLMLLVVEVPLHPLGNTHV